MSKKRYSEEQIVKVLKEVESGTPVAELCRKYPERFIGFIASLPEVERAAVLDQVRELVQSEPAIRGLAAFEMPYRTFTYWCRKS